MQGGEDDGMFKISEIHDTFSDSAADSTLRKSLSTGDMDHDGGEDDADANAVKMPPPLDADLELQRRDRCGEAGNEDEESTLQYATDDTSDSTLPIPVGPPTADVTQSWTAAEPKSRRDIDSPFRVNGARLVAQRPPMVHAATVATPARLRPRLFRQQSFEIDSDSAAETEGSDQGTKSVAAAFGKRDRLKASPAPAKAQERSSKRDPALAQLPGGPAQKKASSTKREEAEAKKSSCRSRQDREKLKDKESSGEGPKTGKKARIQSDRSKYGGKSNSGRGCSGNRTCKKVGEGAEGAGSHHSNTLPNPKKHGKKKRHPGLTITIDNLKESFDGYDKFIKIGADVPQQSPNFCIR